MPFVRNSKYRHVFGTPAKKDQCYEGFTVSGNNVDGEFCAVNPKFIAIVTKSSGGGAFLVLKHDETGRVDPDRAKVCGHKQDVLDLAWNPFNDNMIASGSEDTSVKIWIIPEEGIKTENMVEAAVTLEYHQKRVIQVLWHPTAENILLSSSLDNLVIVWNLDNGERISTIDCHKKAVNDVSWNFDGSLIATTCADKKIRIIDPRTGDVKQEKDGHDGAKISRVSFMRNNKLFTTGFSRMSERQYGIWDATNISRLALETIDSNNAPLKIYYDGDISMVYLVGKGDSLFRYYEITDEAPYCHWLSNYSSNAPQRCIGFMPKRGVNVNTNEVAKIFKVHNKGPCEPLSMTVPRKSELFQDDIFPDTKGLEASITSDEWIAGKNAKPKLISLKDGFVGSGKGEVKSGGLGGGGLKSGGLKGHKSSASSTPAPAASTPAPSSTRSTPAPASTNGSSNQVCEPSPPKEEEKAVITTPKPELISRTPEPISTPKPEPLSPKPEPLSPMPKVENKPDEDDLVIERLQGALTLLTSTVKTHEARIAALEELSHGQNSEINELRSEVDRLRELVEKQEKRIASLESKVGN